MQPKQNTIHDIKMTSKWLQNNTNKSRLTVTQNSTNKSISLYILIFILIKVTLINNDSF